MTAMADVLSLQPFFDMSAPHLTPAICQPDTFNDGSVKRLFSYVPDEISFLPSEFVGMTEDEARTLKAKKDSVYLTGGYVPR